MAELAADQHVRYIVTVEKVTHPSIHLSRPLAPRLLDFSGSSNARPSRAEKGLVRVAGDGAHPAQRRLLGPHHTGSPPQAARRRRRRGRRLDHVLLGCYHPNLVLPLADPRSIFFLR